MDGMGKVVSNVVIKIVKTTRVIPRLVTAKENVILVGPGIYVIKVVD